MRAPLGSGMLHGLHDRIDVQLVAKIHEFLAQARDMDARRNVDEHLNGEHGRTRMSGRIAAGAYLADLDFSSREEAAEAVYDARLIEADDVDGVGQELLAETPRLGALE